MATDAELAGEISIDEKPFVDSMKKAEDAWNKFGDTLKRGDGAFQDAAGRWRAANGQFMTDAEKAAAGIDTSFKKISGSASAMSEAVGTVVANIAMKFASMAAGIVQAGFAFNGLKEQATVAFTNLLGSGEKAKAFLDELQAFAARTPFEFKELTQSAQKLTAMGFAARDVIPMLTAVGNAVAAMGGSAEQVNRVTTALTQMKAKGKVSAEEMMQLAEAGIPAWQILADKIGKSIPEAMKLAEKGAISADVAIAGLIEGMQSKFGGMMEAQSQSWQGLLSTLSDNTAQMAGQIMEPLFVASKDALKRILDGLPEFQTQFIAHWKNIVSEVGSSISQLKPTVEVALNDVKTVWQNQHSEIVNITKTAWSLVHFGFIKPAVEGVSRLISISSSAFAGDWEGAMKRIVGSTDKASSSVLGTVGRWMQALARVNGIITGLGTAVNAASSLGGPRLAVSASVPLKFDTAKLEQDAKDAGKKINTALGAGLKGGGGKGGGANEAEKAARELLASINEYVTASGKGAQVTAAAWANTSESVRQSLIKQKDEFVANRDATSQLVLELRGGLLTTYPQLGAAIANYVQHLEKSTIAVERAAVSTLDFIQPSKAMQKAVDDAAKGIEDASKKIEKASAEMAKEIDKNTREANQKIIDNYNETYSKLQNIVGDGMADILVKIAAASGQSLGRITEVTDGILDVVGGLPGKIGDKLRGATNKFLDFVNGVDRVFKGLHKIFNQVPDGISGMLSKVIDLFKKNSATVGGGGGLFGAIGGFFGKLFGGGGGGTGAAGTGLSEGAASNASGGILKSLGGALGIAGIGASLLPSIIGLFKGKSQIEKDTEKVQLDQLKANLAKTYEDVKAGMIQTMQEGAKLLESLSGFVEVPRKAIKRFLNQLELVLTEFMEMSKGFKTDGIEAGKIVIENLGEGFNFLLTGSQLINAIKDVATITDQNIKDFVATTMKILNQWVEAVNGIELQTAKFNAKISEKLKTSFEFLGLVPEVIKGFAESKPLDASALDSVFASIQLIVQKMKMVSEAERGLELNKAGASAGVFTAIFDSLKSVIEALTAFSTYKPIGDAIFGAITNDLQKLLTWMDETTSLVLAGIDKSITLEEALTKLAGSLSGVKASLSSVTGAFSSSGGSGITASITSGSGAQFVQRQGGGSSQSVTDQRSYTFQINLPPGSDAEQVRRVEAVVRKVLNERDRGHFTTSVSI
jgi:tape measure domain-containing protein